MNPETMSGHLVAIVCYPFSCRSHCKKEVQYDLDEPRIAVYKNTWENRRKYSLLVQFEAWSEERMAVAITLFNTSPAICIEKVVFMKTGEDLHSKVYQSPRSPRRTVLTPNLYHGRQDLSFPKARTSADHQSKRSEVYEETRSAKFEETRSGNIDFIIQGLPHSTVQKEDYDRRELVKKLIRQFDTHLNRDSPMEGLNKTEEFNQFSEKSKEHG